MDAPAAEFTKYAASTTLAERLSLMTEFANPTEGPGVDIERIRVGVDPDPRIGHGYLCFGCGSGGPCFPNDACALDRAAAQVGHDAELLRAIEGVIGRQKRWWVDKVCHDNGGTVWAQVFALRSLAFKPDTDDPREAPSSTVIDALGAAAATVRAFDPSARGEAARLFSEGFALRCCKTKEAAVEGADALIIVTEWREFRSPDFGAIRAPLREPVNFDGRNRHEPRRLAHQGFPYDGNGRGSDIGAG